MKGICEFFLSICFFFSKYILEQWSVNLQRNQFQLFITLRIAFLINYICEESFKIIYICEKQD